jgi:hypothetical protein
MSFLFPGRMLLVCCPLRARPFALLLLSFEIRARCDEEVPVDPSAWCQRCPLLCVSFAFLRKKILLSFRPRGRVCCAISAPFDAAGCACIF